MNDRYNTIHSALSGKSLGGSAGASSRAAPGPAHFGRRIILSVGPLEEWRGTDPGKGLEIVSDGTLNGLKVTCSLHKTIMGQPGASTISIWNLARDTREAIREGLTKVTVRAGWANEQPLIFQGSVSTVHSSRSGPDIVTRIGALPGYGALSQATCSQSFGPGMEIAEVVRNVASRLPGVNVDPAFISGVAGKLAGKGWSFAGSVRNALNQLASEFGFSWSIQDGIFQAVGDKAVLPGSMVELNGGRGGLISVSPLQGGQGEKQNGVAVRAIFIPGVIPGGSVRVKSEITPRLNGEYRVAKASYSLDTFSDDWSMDLECYTRLD